MSKKSTNRYEQDRFVRSMQTREAWEFACASERNAMKEQEASQTAQTAQTAQKTDETITQESVEQVPQG